MLKYWYTAVELMGLPGLPGSRFRIRTRAQAEHWACRQREGRGGGLEYAFDNLPSETQQHLRLQDMPDVTDKEALVAYQLEKDRADKAARQVRKHQGLKDFSALPDGPKKRRARARQWVVNALREFRKTQGGTKVFSRCAFVEAFNHDELDVPKSVLAHMPKHRGQRRLTVASVQRWEDNLVKHGIIALMDNRGQNKGQSVIDDNDELKRLVIGSLIKYPHITGKKIKQFLEAGHAHLNIVSVRAIQRYIKTWKEDNAQTWLFITNPDAWKNKRMAAAGSHFERVHALNQLWEMDSTPGDWMLKDGRHSVLGVIDLYSRRLKLFVSKTSKAMAVCQVFRRSVLDWGIPDGVRTDNGKDYVSNQFAGVLEELEIMQELCIPFASEEKGTIERALQTMSHGILDLLPGFIGHNVTERKQIEARKSFAKRIMTPGEVIDVELTADELQEKLDQWTDHTYAHDEHAGLNGKTPWEMAASWTQPIARIEEERALDLLLAEVAGTRTITKKGIRLDNHSYFHPVLFEHVGRDAMLKRDENDIGRVATYVNGEFIAWAECPELLGISAREAAAASKAHQRKFMQAQKKKYSQYKHDLKDNIAEVILQHRIEKSKKLAAFPQQHTTFHNASLIEASRAADEQDGKGPQASELSDEHKALQQTIAQDIKKAEVKNISQFQTPEDNYAHWARVERQIKNGEPVSEALRDKLSRYQQGSEYASMKMYFESFGLSIDREA